MVVSDTSPLVGLCFLGHLELLRDLFTNVLIPPAVATELRKPEWSAFVGDALQAPYLKVQVPQDAARVRSFAGLLDAGESEAIALALEVHADAILIDEQAGRAIAEQLGLFPVGLLGILLRAKQRGLVGRLAPLLDDLQSGLGFHIGARLREHVLREAGE